MEKQDQDNQMKMCPPYSIHTIRQMLFNNYLYFFIRDIVFFLILIARKQRGKSRYSQGRGGSFPSPHMKACYKVLKARRGQVARILQKTDKSHCLSYIVIIDEIPQDHIQGLVCNIKSAVQVNNVGHSSTFWLKLMFEPNL